MTKREHQNPTNKNQTHGLKIQTTTTTKAGPCNFCTTKNPTIHTLQGKNTNINICPKCLHQIQNHKPTPKQ